MNPFICRPIGIIHTPFTDPAGMPIQPPSAQGKCPLLWDKPKTLLEQLVKGPK